METLSDEKLDLMMSQLGLTDETAMDTAVESIVEGTRWEKAARTANSLFFNIYQSLIRKVYTLFLSAMRLYLSQRFVRYATGEFLQQHRNDHSLDEFVGTKAQHTLKITKEASVTLTITTDDIFYVEEANPRRFRSIQDYEYDSSEEAVYPIVEAVDVGLSYNCSSGLITACETVLPVLTITNEIDSIVQGGLDPETEEELQNRILAVKGQNIRLGIEDYYVNVLKAVGGVADATLDQVDTDATMWFTIFGNGPLVGSVTAEAQETIDKKKMETDVCMTQAATSQSLALVLQIDAEVDITTTIETYFANIPKRTNFEFSLLSDYLYDKYIDLKGVAMRCEPDQADLETGKYFVPIISYEPFEN